jgi:hypothetical protein
LEWVLLKGIPFGRNSFIFQEVLQGAASEKEYTRLNSYLRTQRIYNLKDAIESICQRCPGFTLTAARMGSR